MCVCIIMCAPTTEKSKMEGFLPSVIIILLDFFFEQHSDFVLHLFSVSGALFLFFLFYSFSLPQYFFSSFDGPQKCPDRFLSLEWQFILRDTTIFIRRTFPFCYRKKRESSRVIIIKENVTLQKKSKKKKFYKLLWWNVSRGRYTFLYVH